MNENTVDVPDHLSAQKKRWRRNLGDVGEALVCCYLEMIGWRLVKRKFRVGRSPEIDIVALTPDGLTVFIEVKTRTLWNSNDAMIWYESASQTINERKKKQIIRSANLFRIENRLSLCRYDVVFLGLSRRLASELIEEFEALRKDTNVQMHSLQDTNFARSINYQISEYLAGKGSQSLTVIHWQSAFVTKF